MVALARRVPGRDPGRRPAHGGLGRFAETRATEVEPDRDLIVHLAGEAFVQGVGDVEKAVAVEVGECHR